MAIWLHVFDEKGNRSYRYKKGPLLSTRTLRHMLIENNFINYVLPCSSDDCKQYRNVIMYSF